MHKKNELDELQLLKKLLPSLSEKSLNEFISIATVGHFSHNDIIIDAGNSSHKAFLILDGIVRGFVLSDKGDEKTILLRGQGVFVAYPESAFRHKPSKYIYQSVGKTILLVFNSDHFKKLAKSNPEILQLYISILEDAVLVLNHRVESMITMSNEERYIDLLNRNPQFLKSAYKKDIAYYLGITPVSLSRIIKRLNN